MFEQIFQSETADTGSLGVVKPVAKFRLLLFLRVMENKTVRPVEKRDDAQFEVRLVCEYPRYEEEIEAKRNNTLFDEIHSLQYIDLDGLAEWRVRRCLRSWNFHEILPGFTKKLIRDGHLLNEDSMEIFRALPPLLRKEISAQIWASLGAP